MLEIIITVVILSTSIMVNLQAISKAVKIVEFSVNLNKARILAENLIDTFYLYQDFEVNENYSEDNSFKIDNFYFKYFLFFDSSYKNKILNMEITWKQQYQNHKLNLTTYLR